MINCIYKDICSSYDEKCSDCLNNKEQKMNFFEDKERKVCPVCGEELIKDTSTVLTSYPSQYEYKCRHCQHIEIGF